jgi:hypothetical protein
MKHSETTAESEIFSMPYLPSLLSHPCFSETSKTGSDSYDIYKRRFCDLSHVGPRSLCCGDKESKLRLLVLEAIQKLFDGDALVAAYMLNTIKKFLMYIPYLDFAEMLHVDL